MYSFLGGNQTTLPLPLVDGRALLLTLVHCFRVTTFLLSKH